MTRVIVLSKGYTTFVDDIDYGRLIKIGSWHALVTSHNVYAAKKIRTPGAGQISLLMHRVITNAQPGEFVDHRDSNGLHNCGANLRRCSASQNSTNSANKGKRSQFRGLQPNGDGWCALIMHNGTRHYLGQFENEIDAAFAYDAAARRLHGSFARLNVPCSNLGV